MTERARNFPDDLDLIRAQANKLHAMLTDYTAGIEPSVLYQTIYLTEASRHMELQPWVVDKLNEMREQIASACGISR